MYVAHSLVHSVSGHQSPQGSVTVDWKRESEREREAELTKAFQMLRILRPLVPFVLLLLLISSHGQSGYLDVVVPPDILSGPDGSEGDEGSIPENGTVRLCCIATGVPKPTVQWRREGGRDIILRSEGGRDNKHGT